MAKKRKEMTENQKEKQRQADRESKARRRTAKKKPSRFVNTKSEVKKKYIEHEREFNILYKVRVRVRGLMLSMRLSSSTSCCV